MAKYLVGIAIGDTPTYDASAKTITFDSATFKDKYSTSPIEFIINNATNNLIYKEGLTGKGGTWDSANHTLTLDFDTTADGSTDSDSLTIWADIKDGKRGVDFLSQMYVEGIANAQNDDVEGKLDTMRTEQNAKLDKLAEIPDTVIVESTAGGPGKDIVVADNNGTKELHVVDAGGTPDVSGGSTKVATADLIVSVKGIEVPSGQTKVDIKIEENNLVKVPTFPLAPADSVDARGDKLKLDDQTTTTSATGGKVLITAVKL
tara:strand:+ start:4690 stop:5472 length:783 start_codon:yes stop_codon:yes gene_type:complete